VFGMVTSEVSGWVHNGFRLRRREADVQALRGTGAHFLATQGRKQRGLASRVELGWGSVWCWADAEKTSRDPFPIFKFLFPFDFSGRWK
jgi:hypothetical protein